MSHATPPPTRRRAPRNDFNRRPAANDLVGTLASDDCRVLTISQNGTVEVAHEKLFTAWPRLKKWIDDQGGAIRQLEHATESARRWQERGQLFDELWPANNAKEVETDLQRLGRRDELLEQFLHPQPILVRQLKQETLSHERRAGIGEKLDEFGDTRPGVGLREDGLPDIAWSEGAIGPGEVEIEDYGPVQIENPFLLAVYPVTNAQFGAFINASDGYQNGKWWEHLVKPDQPKSPSWPQTSRPRENVDWFEAMAFCRWLTKKYHDAGLLETNKRIRLPTEGEWQLAATGGNPENQYPWGPKWDAARCNGEEGRLNRTTPVGIYPDGKVRAAYMI